MEEAQREEHITPVLLRRFSSCKGASPKQSGALEKPLLSTCYHGSSGNGGARWVPVKALEAKLLSAPSISRQCRIATVRARRRGEKVRMFTVEPLGFCWRDGITARAGTGQGIAQGSPSRGSKAARLPQLSLHTSVASSGHHRQNKSRRHNKFEKCFVYKQDSPPAVLGILQD